MRKRKVVEGQKSGYTFWPEKCDKPFVECILECVEKRLIVDGICKNGVYGILEKMMEERLPGCGIRAKPHIEGRFKKWKKIWHAMTLMRNQSGWGWDEVNKCVICPDNEWDAFEQVSLQYYCLIYVHLISS
ncbi:unnamed protein product [Linum tenue]|uniref:Myb/SANT-like domain-containing protein n=1 Tax=Linum tenue TaxID=586396 RepID=A0AAV0L479_9ROSI|nr:unnamed protein product [Linum tenue]